jgi:sec-independent protein translocase protein TatA
MGIAGVSPLSLILILLIIVVLFGSSKLKNIGEDLGSAVKSFRKAMDDTQRTLKKDDENT